MQVLEFTDSSAIAKIQFDNEQNQVGVAYTYKPELFYVFGCDDVSFVKEQVEVAESIGKLISQLKKEGTLQKI